MKKHFRMGKAKVNLMLFIESLGIEKFTIEDLISKGYKEGNLARLLINMTEQGLLKKEDRFYELTSTFRVFIPEIKKRIDEKERAEKEKLVPKDNDYLFQVNSTLSRNQRRIREIDLKIRELKDLKKEKDTLELENMRLEDLKRKLEEDRDRTVAIIEGAKTLLRK